MDCYHLMYKHITFSSPFEKFIQKEVEKELVDKRDLFYDSIVKLNSNWSDLQLIQQLGEDINPFEHSLSTMKEIIAKKYPTISQEMVDINFEYVYNKKVSMSRMIKESKTVIEQGNEFIHNGRNLMKEDFSYNLRKEPANKSHLDTSLHKKNSSMNEVSLRSKTGSVQKTENLSQKPSRRLSRGVAGQSSRRGEDESAVRYDLLNEMIASELRKEKKHENIKLILENDPEDILIKEDLIKKNPGFTDRQMKRGPNSSFPHFEENDVIVAVDDGMETGRTEMQELNFFLEEVSGLGESGPETSTSRLPRVTTHINRENMENLYSAHGNLKVDVIKRAMERMKRHSNGSRPIECQSPYR